jgi:transposase
MKQSGLSGRAIARETGHDRATIRKIWNEYCEQVVRLNEPCADVRAIQLEMTTEKKYPKRERARTKYTPELDKRLQEILASEGKKDRLLGEHKQKLNNSQIHGIVVAEGFDISRSTIDIELARLRRRSKEVFIRQKYELGDRLEYDFGEVKLDCGDGVKVYHMAVLSSPGGGFCWAYLYTNEKKAVFLDSQVRFFEMMGGCYREVVYDNMRNVVKKFIGKNEKELNDDLVQLAAYYGFRINVTNCFAGNEKGHVESSVKNLRKQIFSPNYTFGSLDEAREFLHSELKKRNEDSRMEEEKSRLLPYKPPFELACISENTVSNYGFICVDSCFYSVPEYMVGHKVFVKKYHEEILVYAGNQMLCKHKRIFGRGNMQVDIRHYLNTLLRKPGAVRNSVALKSIPRLKAIFDTHYSETPKKFIEMFQENSKLPIDDLIKLFEEKTRQPQPVALEILGPATRADVSARAGMAKYSALINKGVA